ncbi:MAG: hypothetical protein G01um101477_230, partial [Candidatus Doudnabacteria bacterium Gr01-1014_77]
ILKVAKRGSKNVIYDTDPQRLVKKVIKAVKEQNKSIEKQELNVRKRRITSPE